MVERSQQQYHHIIKTIIGISLIAYGIHVMNCTELHDLQEGSDKKETYAEGKNHNSTISNEKFESVETLDPHEDGDSKQSEKRTNKREQRTFGQLYPLAQKPKPKPELKTIGAPYPQQVPYHKEDSNPQDINHPKVSTSTSQGNYYMKELVKHNTTMNSPSLPLVASDIDIRRAVPFENDYINRHYASKVHFPPATLSPGVASLNPQVVSVPPNQLKSDDYNNQDVPIPPLLSPLAMYHPLIKRLNSNHYQFPPSFFPPPSFLPNSADELNRFRNLLEIPQVEPTQNFIPSTSMEYDETRFVPWIPPGYEHLQPFSSVDRFYPGTSTSAQPTSTGFNMEVSEIGEPAFIVPENVGKVGITIPEPFAPVRTYGLSINDAQITRNEVRKDNGEFLSSYTTSDGTERLDSGALVPTADGDQVLVLRGSYSFTSPEGLRFRVDYTADETGYHATQVPVSEIPEAPRL